MESLTTQDPGRIGPFRLVARLGRGGMGRVYLGRDESTGRHAAVKTIHGELAADPEFRTRFTQEVNAALRVADEYITEVIAADPAAPVPRLATAYVPGISVEDAVRRYGPMPAESVRVLGFCVARAVAAIHAVGLVHRDLKPGNVLLTAQGPKVIDFGIARGVGDEGLTKTGMVAGSPPYMAPEQLTTGDFGTASDVFSLGAILHYAATAAGPYGRGSAQELYARALAIGPVLAPELPDAVAGPVSQALAREPGLRPSAAQLGAALEREPGERPAPGWLPGNVIQEILTQATEALNTASAAYNTSVTTPQPTPTPVPTPPPTPVPSPQRQPQPFAQPQPQVATGVSQGPVPSFAPPYPQSGPPSHPSNPRNPYGQPQQMFQPSYPGTPPRATPTPPGPTPLPGYQGPVGAYGPRPGTPPSGMQYRYPATAVTRTNGMGTAGLTLSLIGLILPGVLVLGIIFSSVGISRARSGTMPAGRARAGLAVSLIAAFGWIIVGIIVKNRG